MMVYCEAGTVNGGVVFILTTTAAIVLGTTPLTFRSMAIPFSNIVYTTVAGTTYALVLTDANKRLLTSNAASKTVTVPPQTGGGGVAFPVNTEIEFWNSGAGDLTLAPGSGVTINSQNGILVVPQNGFGKLKKRGNPNTWDFYVVRPKTVLRSDASANLTAGYTATSFDNGTKTTGTFTPDPASGGIQHYTNGGAHTLAPPSTGTGNATIVTMDITNNASAGAIATSGFTKVAGDAFTTTNGHKFRCSLSVGNAGSLLQVQAMQ